jgi:hypothetical protein
MTLVVLLLPLAAYVIVALRAASQEEGPLRSPWAPIAAAFLVTVVAAGAVAWTLLTSSPIQTPSRVVWSGIETARPNDALLIGGRPQQSLIGWPNGAFAPALRVEPPRSGKAVLTISGGRGFVEFGDRVLNGSPLGSGSPVRSGVFTVTADTWLFGLVATFRIHRDGVRVVEFIRWLPGEPRVVAMQPQIAAALFTLRKDGKRAGEAAAIEAWAEGVRLLESRRETRLLDQEGTYQTEPLDLPVELRIRWSGLTLRVVVRSATEGRMALVFPPPWRLSSPIPPPLTADDPERSLTVTARAIPGDEAFLIPFGGRLGDFRSRLAIVGDRFAQAEHTPASSPFSPPGLRAGQVAGITSRESINTGPLWLQFATTQDLPPPQHFVIALGIALLIFLIGLCVTVPGLRPDDGWTIAGLAATTWAILALRLLLACRYALDADHLDRYTVRGVALAVFGLTLIPPLLLLAARLWRDQFTDLTLARARAGLWLLLYVPALFGAALVHAAHFGHRDHSDRSIVITEIGGS